MDLAQAINRVLEEPKLAARLESQARAFLDESFHVRLGELLLVEYGLLASGNPESHPALFRELEPAAGSLGAGHARAA